MIGIITFSSSCPAWAASATVRSQPCTWNMAMFSISASTGLTLPGMMLEPGCTGRQADLVQAGGRAGGQQAEIVGDAGQGDRQGAQGGREIGRICHGLHALEQVVRGVQRQAGQLGEALHHAGVVFRVGVQPAAGRRAADAQAAQAFGGCGGCARRRARTALA